MRKFVLALFACLFFAPLLFAQHSVSLGWVISTDDTTANCTTAGTCSQTVYRAQGACAATSSFISLGSLASSQTTYIDTSVPGGMWCYAVTFTLNGVESPKVTTSVSLLPASPTGLAVTKTT